MKCGQLVARLNCFDPQEDVEDIDLLRQRGQDELRKLIHGRQPVNWRTVMETAHDLQIREESIMAKQELEAQRTLDKTLRGKKKRYDRFGPIITTLLTHVPPKELGNRDDEMSMGLLLTTKNDKGIKTDTTASPTDASYQNISDTSSSRGSLSDDDQHRCRSYFIRDEVNF